MTRTVTLWASGLDPANDENYREREQRPDAQMEACIIANSKDIYIVHLKSLFPLSPLMLECGLESSGTAAESLSVSYSFKQVH